jgi:hypothetical protein
MMMQPGQPFRQYDANGQSARRNSAPQIYSVSSLIKSCFSSTNCIDRLYTPV